MKVWTDHRCVKRKFKTQMIFVLSDNMRLSKKCYQMHYLYYTATIVVPVIAAHVKNQVYNNLYNVF